jgi:hypothetical protein
MSWQNQDTGLLVEELLCLTEDALKAARIEHQTALSEALGKRHKVISLIWGLDPDKALPEFDKNHIDKQRSKFSNINRETVTKIHELEGRLFAALDAQKRRIRAEEGRLNNGRNFLLGMQNMYSNNEGKKFDRVG